MANLESSGYAGEHRYINVSLEDHRTLSVYPEDAEPFEYAPGLFVNPQEEDYLSTVYYTFINKIAQKVGEKYPNVTINTLAYYLSLVPPRCEIENNVSIWFCPNNEDYSQKNFDEVVGDRQIRDVQCYKSWIEKHPNVMLYTYYFTHFVMGWYERPIWYRMQSDLQYYANCGVLGLRVETRGENPDAIYNWQKAMISQDPVEYQYRMTELDTRLMNLMSYWIYYKLCWNPYEDVDALIEKFCDKVYKDASPYMQEYYRILKMGWDDGGAFLATQFNSNLILTSEAQIYYDYFINVEVDGIDIHAAIKENLNKAWEAADDKTKEYIRPHYEAFSDWTRFLE
jgi:hypothetical protein